MDMVIFIKLDVVRWPRVDTSMLDGLCVVGTQLTRHAPRKRQLLAARVRTQPRLAVHNALAAAARRLVAVGDIALLRPVVFRALAVALDHGRAAVDRALAAAAVSSTETLALRALVAFVYRAATARRRVSCRGPGFARCAGTRLFCTACPRHAQCTCSCPGSSWCRAA